MSNLLNKALVAMVLLPCIPSDIAADDRPAAVSIPPDYDTCVNGRRCPTDLFAALQRGDVARMRRHAWNVFAGMTQTDPKSGLPIFRTWYRKCELNQSLNCGYELPVQFLAAQNYGPEDSGQRLAHTDPAPHYTINFYNSEFKKYVVDGSPPLCDPKVLAKLLKDLAPKNIEDHHIDAFPTGAIAVKTGWWTVRAGEPTIMPIWDPEANSQTEPNGNSPVESPFNQAYPYGRWSRFVAVDAGMTQPDPQRFMEIRRTGKPTERVHVVPLSSFYRVRIGPRELPEIQRLSKGRVPFEVTANDYLVLAALHFTTKEIPNWVWATFWWHDRPDTGPYGFDRPGLVLGRFRNYLMNVSYSMNDPREPDGGPHIAFNPWLEGPQTGGVTSNCMSCHRRATWPLDVSMIDTKRGEVSTADEGLFDRRLKLDFIWTLASIKDNPEGKACPAPPAKPVPER
jgi:hypothetical protein